jgi:hypothetical protein
MLAEVFGFECDKQVTTLVTQVTSFLYFVSVDTSNPHFCPLGEPMNILLVCRWVDGVSPLQMSPQEIETDKGFFFVRTDIAHVRLVSGMTGFMTLAFVLA